MSALRITRGLLRVYPAAWRDRYGAELESLILETADGRRVPWRIGLDVARAAARERVREIRGGGTTPAERACSGAILSLWAWLLFVCAGVAVQKLSEHWESAVPTAQRSLPAGAFDTLVAAAAVGSVLVAGGLAACLPALFGHVRSAGLRQAIKSVSRSTIMTLVAAAACVGVVVWAHRLSSSARNGGDDAYAAIVVAVALLVAACLASWVATAAGAARRAQLPPRVLRFEALVASGVALVMATMTAATLVWWHAVAGSAPWFIGGAERGAPASGLSPSLAAAVLLMVVATALAATGARRAIRASAVAA